METRQRILAVARKHLPTADQLGVEDIAELAQVSIQTIYTHFGSKGGLFLALADEVEREAGLFVALDRVWRCHHGEEALRIALDGAFGLWQNAWDFIAFGLRVRRTDAELGARLDGFDRGRLGLLLVICRRLQKEDRLAGDLPPGRAARLVFALTTPYVYEALVVQAGIPPQVARQLVVEAVIGAVLRPDSRPVIEDSIDWKRLGLRSMT
jgi:AcrR family transcriptional regulator